MHGYATYLDDLGGPSGGLHELSHGESFNRMLDEQLNHPGYAPGFACLDEPEAGLSFGSLLRWVGSLHEMTRRGAQVVCATHSPVLAAVPGATILELGEWGIRRTTWDELELVAHWRSYLADPARYLRHLLD
ncbi:AAA family ATPase [Agromyces sp. G08B096]|uniref:AAA family ATPase n=1 Tax=Agromyces sp. G08B096 TaxID=3156399 RepID=A0AAU7WAP2_9MICO